MCNRLHDVTEHTRVRLHLLVEGDRAAVYGVLGADVIDPTGNDDEIVASFS